MTRDRGQLRYSDAEFDLCEENDKKAYQARLRLLSKKIGFR
jgi:hypothetical protein